MKRINKFDGKNLKSVYFLVNYLTDYVSDCMDSPVRSFPLSTYLILITTDDVYSLILIEFSRQLLFCTADPGRKIDTCSIQDRTWSKIKESVFLSPPIQPLSFILDVVR